MAVPDFQSWFLPLLRRVGDGKSRLMSDLYEELAIELGLSEEDRNEGLPSGKQLKYKNRIGWARTYLKKAGLLESPSRGEIQITPRGLQLLANPPDRLDVKYLGRFPEFAAFQTYKSSKTSDTNSEVDSDSSATPEEALEQAHRTLRENTTQELLERVKAADPSFFESLVVELLLRMGYGGSREDAGRTVGRSGDGGIDGMINEDRLGLDVVYIQAKRWDNTVGRPVVQAFAGSLEGVRARKGILITTSTFSAEALGYVSQIEKRIVLIDGEQLANLMFEHDLAISPVASYEVKKVDTDYFEEV